MIETGARLAPDRSTTALLPSTAHTYHQFLSLVVHFLRSSLDVTTPSKTKGLNYRFHLFPHFDLMQTATTSTDREVGENGVFDFLKFYHFPLG
jgi:hypothetical protein